MNFFGNYNNSFSEFMLQKCKIFLLSYMIFMIIFRYRNIELFEYYILRPFWEYIGFILYYIFFIIKVIMGIVGIPILISFFISMYYININFIDIIIITTISFMIGYIFCRKIHE